MKPTINNVYLFLLIGVMCMVNNYGCTGGSLRYEQYIGKNQELNIGIDYISQWLYRENKDLQKGYASVVFFEDSKGENYKPKIAITAQDLSKIDVLETLEALTDDLVKKRLKFKDAKLLSRSKADVMGLDAREILLSYKAMDKIYSVDAKLIPVKEKIIIFMKPGKAYSLRYENTEQGFDRFSKAFDHMVKTFKFNDPK
ncbi:MAG: hypothetical protein WC695_09015 [Candidatus Omnitrophota bacterium]